MANTYKRILLKLSGEALLGEQGHGIDGKILHQYAKEIKSIHDEGTEICIVIGGGNIFRGVKSYRRYGPCTRRLHGNVGDD